MANSAVHVGGIGADRSPIWDCSGLDDVAYRPGGGAARGRPFRWRRPLLGTEVAGNRADRGVAGFAVRRSSAWPEPSKPGAPEFRIRDAGPVYRLDQSNARQLQTGANGADFSPN